jgi:hypothetical protein
MARAFLQDGDRIVAILDDTERTVLAGLIGQTRDLLAPDIEPTGDAWSDLVASMGAGVHGHDAEDGGGAGPTEDPDDADDRDPALDRLLPAGHRGDDEIATEFRRLTEEDADALQAALERLDDDDPFGYAIAWYDFLTWLQETLTSALLGEPGSRA